MWESLTQIFAQSPAAWPAALWDALKQLHSSGGLETLIRTGGTLLACAIIFAETGLLIGFFLPGDSLLITLGVLANPANPAHVPGLEIGILWASLSVCAVVGDQVGFWLGSRVGDRIWERPDSRWFKKDHLRQAHAMTERAGGWAVVGARYVPIMRTFVPFAAGMARMRYRAFVFWNIGGGLLWVTSLLGVGYFLGQTELANRLDKIIVLVVLVSVLPLIVGTVRTYWRSRAAPSA